jgi:hypothetical protein
MFSLFSRIEREFWYKMRNTSKDSVTKPIKKGV